MQKSLYLGRFLALVIEPYKNRFKTSEKDVVMTSLRDVLSMSVGHVHFSYILDHMATSSKRLQETSYS